MADHHDGQVRMLAAGQLDDAREVVHERLDVLDHPFLALGGAVAVMVAGVDGGALVGERRGDVLVAAGMLAEAVDDDGDERGVVATPAVKVQAALAALDGRAHWSPLSQLEARCPPGRGAGRGRPRTGCGLR
jgi:hypothetical protein